jgi:hypothetical protein
MTKRLENDKNKFSVRLLDFSSWAGPGEPDSVQSDEVAKYSQDDFSPIAIAMI